MTIDSAAPLSRGIARLLSRAGRFTLLTLGLYIAPALLASELYLRHFSFDPFAYYTRLPGFHMIFDADPEAMPGVAHPADYSINRYGLRGTEPISGKWIVLIGGSTAEDPFLKLENTWAVQLQHLLPGTWVGNMGKAGTTALCHALALEKILPRLPQVDKVIVYLGLNDMLFDLGLHRPPDLPPGWHLAQTFAYRPEDATGLLDNFATYHMLRDVLRDWPFNKEIVTFDGTSVAAYKRRRAAVRPQDFLDTLPDMEPFQRNYRDNLARIVTAIGEERTVFVTHPSLWKEKMSPEETKRLYFGGLGSPDVWLKDDRVKWMTPGALLHALALYNRTVLDFCRDHAIPCIDLASELPNERAYYLDDAHFSDAGGAAAARIVARHLREAR
jgi:hypothetical protein